MLEARVKAATLEHDGSMGVCHTANETMDDDGSVLLWSKFHKTLPHDSLGQVSRGRHLTTFLHFLFLFFPVEDCG